MNKEMSEIFYQRLRKIMKACKLKNTDLAKGLGKKKQIVSNYFTGKTDYPWEKTCKLISFLQQRIGRTLDINFLFGNSESDSLLHTIQKLQSENISLRKAYDELIMKYVLLNDKCNQNTNKLIQKSKK